jgi:ribosomal protein L37AE/L43A
VKCPMCQKHAVMTRDGHWIIWECGKHYAEARWVKVR